MCGIAGIIDFTGRPVLQEELKKMTDAIVHRGPDGEGFFVESNVGFGHRRLSIIDLSSAAAQPMTRFGLTITYNGEIYNYKELRNELENQGVAFSTQSDTEVILAAYHTWGKHCVQRFNGMWAFAIYDAAHKEVFLSRDRFGEKPFYYTKQNDRFVFCSEIRGILATGKTPEANIDMLSAFLLFEQAEHPTTTFFNHIHKLKAGHNCSITLGTRSVDFGSFFEWKEAANSLQQNQLQLRDNYRYHLNNAVRLRLRSDVPVGTCLSSGLDSSSIVAALSNYQAKECLQWHAFTATSPGASKSEFDVASVVAHQYDCKHIHIAPTAAEVAIALPAVVRAQEEPFISTSVLMQYFVMQRAAQQGIKVLLDGQGADELFLGYNRYLPPLVAAKKWLQKHASLLAILRHTNLGVFKLAMLFLYHAQTTIKSKVQRFRWRTMIDKAYNSERLTVLEEYKKNAQQSVRTLQKADLDWLSLPALLRYEDKNAMAFSVETRLPYLDTAFVEWANKLPVDILFANGWTKYINRISMQAYLPNAVVWSKHKLSFEGPTLSALMSEEECMGVIKDSILLRYLFPKLPSISNQSMLWRLLVISIWEKEMKVEVPEV